jgi:hypothetical protein
MAVRNDFAPGEVLAAADLNDTFASRVPFAFGTATPTTTTAGFLWYDTNFTPPVGKVWNGSAFVNFSQGPADFSDAATGTYTDSGINYKYITYTASGTLTVTRAGFADVLVVGGGGGGGNTGNNVNSRSGAGGGGGVLQVTNAYLAAGTATITVGGGGSGGGGDGVPSAITEALVGLGGGSGSPSAGGTGRRGGSGGGGSGLQIPSNGGTAYLSTQGNSGGNGDGSVAGSGGGAGGAASGATAGAGLSSSITGSAVTRAAGGVQNTNTAGGANTGDGGGGGTTNGGSGANGGSGVVIIRVKV